MKIRQFIALLSKYRTPIMGLCILDVLFGHTGMYFMGPLNYILKCYWTIDIFFFFSGMGAFYSLSKNDNMPEFYKRRIKRIYIPYLPVILVFCLVFCIFGAGVYSHFELLRQVLGNILLLGWINGLENQLNWYPQVIMIVYLLTPSLFALVKSFKGDRKKMAALLGFVVVMQLCFIGTTYLVAVSRLINFTLGLIAAELAYEDADIKLNIPLLLIFALIGHALCFLGQRGDEDLVWQYGISWYPAILLLPGTLLVFCWILDFISAKKYLKPLMQLFNISGRYSFEIFLVHMLFYYAVPLTLKRMPQNNLDWVFFALAALVLSLGYGRLMDTVTDKSKKRRAESGQQ